MKLFKRIWQFIESFFMRLEGHVEKLVPVAVNVTEAIKAVVDNRTTAHVLDLIKFLIPGDTDDKIIDKVMDIARDRIPKIAIQLQIVKSITDLENVNDQMVAVVEALKKVSKEQQNMYWHEFAKQVLYTLADGRITWGEAAMLAEYHYKNLNNK